MNTKEINQIHEVVDQKDPLFSFMVGIEFQTDPELSALLSALSPETPWGDRQIAAKKIGYLRDPNALPWLLAALPADPFWMVRIAIIQAIELIGDPRAIPALQQIAEKDDFKVVRSYAIKAEERLSH